MNRARALRWQFSLYEGPDLLTSITVRGPRRHFNHHVRRFPLGRFRNLRVNVVVSGGLKLRSNQETVERDSLRFDSGHSLGCWNLTRNIPIQRACHLQPIRDTYGISVLYLFMSLPESLVRSFTAFLALPWNCRLQSSAAKFVACVVPCVRLCLGGWARSGS